MIASLIFTLSILIIMCLFIGYQLIGKPLLQSRVSAESFITMTHVDNEIAKAAIQSPVQSPARALLQFTNSVDNYSLDPSVQTLPDKRNKYHLRINWNENGSEASDTVTVVLKVYGIYKPTTTITGDRELPSLPETQFKPIVVELTPNVQNSDDFL